MLNIELTKFKGFEAVKIIADDAYAIIVPELGSNVVRFRDDAKGIDVFRYEDNVSGAEMDAQREVWGLPSLYLPNRFGKGILRTSDALYQLPINEPAFGNHIHGFLHKRKHSLKSNGIIKEKNTVYAETEYVYDKNDEFYQYFPVDFIANVRIELTYKDGSPRLYHNIKLNNISAKQLPVSLCTHTAFKAPFVEGGEGKDITLEIPVLSRIDIDKSTWLPTGKPNLPLTEYDETYKYGKSCPVYRDICNEMYALDINSENVSKVIIKDTKTGGGIINILSSIYKFLIVWNDGGNKGYFCPEPMTAQIDAPNLAIPPDESGYFELAPNAEVNALQAFAIV
jgi:aldose 1-epimerase